MTQRTRAKGPKFETKKSVNEQAKPGEARFEIELPKALRELIASEQRLVNQEIEAYIQRRNEDLDRTIRYILRGSVTTMQGIPEGIVLAPNDDYTKLVQK